MNCRALSKLIAITVVYAAVSLRVTYASDDVFALDIPKATDAAHSLDALAEETGYHLFFPASEFGEIATNALYGCYTLPQAVDALLEGTPLNAVVTDKRVIVVSMRPKDQPLNSHEGSEMETDRQTSHAETRKERWWPKIIAAILGTASIQSGNAQQSIEPTERIEEVVAKGFRNSLKESVDTKRDAVSSVDAITAEDIGKFSAKNIGEALATVPGVTIDRQFGDGENISIRGTAPVFNRTLLNGQTIATANWFILNNPGRSFNYTLLPPEMVGSVDIYKTPEAWIDEGSIGATVMINTRKPLDLPTSTRSFSAEYGYHDRSGEGSPSFSGLLGWRNQSKSYGAVVSFMHHDMEQRRDGIETFSYPTAGSFAPDQAFPEALNIDPNTVFPNAINSAHFEQTRERSGAFVALQARPNDTLEFEGNFLYEKADYDNFNQSRFAFIGASLPNATDATVENGLVTSGTFGPGSTINQDALIRDSEIELYSAHLVGSLTREHWDFKTEVGKTRATGGTQRQYALGFGPSSAGGGFSYDISGAPGAPASLTFLDDPADPASLPVVTNAQFRTQPTTDEEVYVQGDLEYNFTSSVFTSFQAGIKYRAHETTQSASQTTQTELADGLGLADFAAGLTPSDFQSGQHVIGVDYRLADPSAVRTFIDTFSGQTMPLLSAAFDVEEDISSAYGQLNFAHSNGRLRGNFGLRYVRTELTSFGSVASGPAQTPVTVESTYDDWLPSLNLVYEVRDDVLLRASASRNLSRPQFSQLAAFTNLQNILLTGNGGNPNLDPSRSNNLEFGVEWYDRNGGLLSAALFYKDVGSYVISITQPEEIFDILTNTVQTFSITRPNNGAGGSIEGVELIAQKNLTDSFGITANYTYSNGDTDDGNEIPFNSEHSVSITPYFENNYVSANITYGYRSEYFRAIGRGGVVTTTDDIDSLDAAITYHFNEQIDFTFSGQNLLDETHYDYAQGTVAAPLSVYKNGRRFFFGIRYAF